MKKVTRSDEVKEEQKRSPRKSTADDAPRRQSSFDGVKFARAAYKGAMMGGSCASLFGQNSNGADNVFFAREYVFG